MSQSMISDWVISYNDTSCIPNQLSQSPSATCPWSDSYSLWELLAVEELGLSSPLSLYCFLGVYSSCGAPLQTRSWVSRKAVQRLFSDENLKSSSRELANMLVLLVICMILIEEKIRSSVPFENSKLNTMSHCSRTFAQVAALGQM